MITRTPNTTDSNDLCKMHGQCVRNRREAKELTQVQAANSGDVTQSYYQGVESGSKGVRVDRIAAWGDDFVKLGTVDFLLGQLEDRRYTLVEANESEDEMCPEAGYRPFVRVLGKMLHEYSMAMDDESMDMDELGANLEVLRELLKKGARLERGMERRIAVEKLGGKQFPRLTKVRTGEVAESKAGGAR